MIRLSLITIFLCGVSFLVGFKFNKEQRINTIEKSIEYIEVPVGNEKILNQYIDCRKNLIEITEVYYEDINCRYKTCE